MSDNPAFPISREQAENAISISERINPHLPDYYNSMFADSYQPWEIKEAAKKSFFRDYLERLDDYEDSQRDPMDDIQLSIRSEVVVNE